MERHPDMATMEYTIGETLMDPDAIYWDPAYPEEVQLYYRWFYGLPIGDERICVTVGVFERDAFVMTAHIVSHIKGEQLIWTKSNG